MHRSTSRALTYPLVALLLACAPDPAPGEPAWAFPELSELPGLRGSGGPAVAFEEDELWTACASLTGGTDDEEDQLHHNLVMPYRGHLVLPWVPEWSRGGISLFDMADPCDPVLVGSGYYDHIRESHSLGFLHIPEGEEHAGDYMAATGSRGITLWDLTDETAPAMLSYLQVDEVIYPDAYARVVLSVFWQHPYLFAAAADNGIMVFDTSDPTAPVHLGTTPIEPALRAGGVFLVGNLMLVTGAEQREAVLLDASDPLAIQPIGGGRFSALDSTGEAFEAYHGNLTGPHAIFARKEGGGGVMMMDITDPTNPTYAGDYLNPSGNGGYVFYDEGFVFTGESNIASVYDVRDPSDITMVGQADLPGDLDTMTPYGNVAVLSVDDDAEDGIASTVVPWTTEPDGAPPEVTRIEPHEGQTGLALTSRLGVVFNEPIEPISVLPGSLRLYDEEGRAVPGWGSAQENIATFSPKEPLLAGQTYTFEVLAGGAADLNGNTLAETVTVRFRTVDP